MIRSRNLHVLAIAACLGIAGAASAQTIGYNIRTGDVWVDARLGEINDYGRYHRDPFIDEMAGHYGAPRPLLVDLLDHRDWAPADVYYACAIAHALGMPCIDVVHEYDRHPGQGWGAVAKRLGIKPGSPAFHALKRGQVETYRRWGRTIVVDRPIHVDWSGGGRGNGHGRSSSRHDSGPPRGNGNKGSNGKSQGNQGRSHGNNGNGHGNNGKKRGNDRGKP